MSRLDDEWGAELAIAAAAMADDVARHPAPTTRTAFPYWIGCSTLELIASADEYEQAVNEGRFADEPDVAADLLATAADIRTEIARRQNEHWHGTPWPGSACVPG